MVSVVLPSSRKLRISWWGHYIGRLRSPKASTARLVPGSISLGHFAGGSPVMAMYGVCESQWPDPWTLDSALRI